MVVVGIPNSAKSVRRCCRVEEIDVNQLYIIERPGVKGP
jgi:hypothetical protein